MSDTPITPSISTLAMVQDPRLRRMFALVGLAIDGGIADLDVEDRLLTSMFDLAPEYAPPFEDDLRAEWAGLVKDACGLDPEDER